MITYDLICQSGHEFEGWFKDRKSYEKQMKSKQVVCHDNHVKMIITRCAVQTRNRDKAEKIKKELNRLSKIAREVSNYARDHFRYVGSDFPEEARKIQRGEGKSEEEGIWGTTTPEEEKELKKEGVKFFKIPKPQKLDS